MWVKMRRVQNHCKGGLDPVMICLGQLPVWTGCCLCVCVCVCVCVGVCVCVCVKRLNDVHRFQFGLTNEHLMAPRMSLP